MIHVDCMSKVCCLGLSNSLLLGFFFNYVWFFILVFRTFVDHLHSFCSSSRLSPIFITCYINCWTWYG